MFIDTHAHIYEDDFAPDIDAVVQRAREAGALKVLLPPTDEASTLKAVELSRRFPGFCHPMIGLHPEDVHDDYPLVLQRLEQMLKEPHPTPPQGEGAISPPFKGAGGIRGVSPIAIGEVGLDYYWDKTHKQEQRDAFRTQIQWAATYQLPLMIHSRNAGNDLLDTLAPWRGQLTRGGVFHCFSGSVETARQLLNFQPNFYIGIGGVLTFKKSNLPETVRHIPLDRIVLETDSPYMAPTPMRGHRNEPAYIPYIIDRLAEAKGLSPAEVADITTRNALRIFFPER